MYFKRLCEYFIIPSQSFTLCDISLIVVALPFKVQFDFLPVLYLITTQLNYHVFAHQQPNWA